MRLCPSLFDVGLLSFSLYMRSESFQLFLSEEVVPYLIADSVFLRQGESRVHLRHHLEPEPLEAPS